MTMTTPLSPYITHSRSMLAHTVHEPVTGQIVRSETVEEHSMNAFHIYQTMDKEFGISESINRILEDVEWSYRGNTIKLSNTSRHLVQRMKDYIVLFHDSGKVNPGFQIEKMKNCQLLSIHSIPYVHSLLSDHSFLSTAMYIDVFYDEIKRVRHPVERLMMQYLLLLCAYIIYTHHESLSDMEAWATDLDKKVYEKIRNYPDSYLYFWKDDSLMKGASLQNVIQTIKNSNIRFDGVPFYIFSKLMQSVLIASDFISTHQFYIKKKEIDFTFGSFQNTMEVVSFYKNTDMIKGIQKQRQSVMNKEAVTFFEKQNQPINVLREEMFSQAERELLAHLEKNLLNLEMPTGSGKTNTSLNLALMYIQKQVSQKIIYTFPFNTLADQTVERVKELTGNLVDVEVLNSITAPLLRKEDGGDVNYKATLLDRQLWNYPFVLTSHVSLFRVLFGTSRESSMPLFQFSNSVIILDEIQAYRNVIWREIVEMLYRYAKWLNIRIIIMSATLPNLQNLIHFDADSFVSLIPNPQPYFHHALFAQRVQIDLSLLQEVLSEETLQRRIEAEVSRYRQLVASEVQEVKGTKVLIQFIKKKSAVAFYNHLISHINLSQYDVRLLTGDDQKYERQQIIQWTKENQDKHTLLVTTQLIEAGVDIDMDLGFKDKSLLDNEEQFLGRINRNGKKKHSTAFFFHWDDERSLYAEDMRLAAVPNEHDYFRMLRDKDFVTYYERAMERINEVKNSYGVLSIDRFYEHLRYLHFDEVEEHMKLIDSETFQIFLPYTLVMENEQGQVVVVNGEAVWNDYMELLTDTMISYAKRRVQLMQLREKLQYFTFSVYGVGIEGLDQNGGMYYIDGGDTYIVDNKFQREDFERDYVILK